MLTPLRYDISKIMVKSLVVFWTTFEMKIDIPTISVNNDILTTIFDGVSDVKACDHTSSHFDLHIEVIYMVDLFRVFSEYTDETTFVGIWIVVTDMLFEITRIVVLNDRERQRCPVYHGLDVIR